MADYLIQGKTLDEIAHAINEKGGWQNIYRADEMAEAIESIPSGGSLPSVISKIDGGSFTLADNTLTASHTIQHNLGIIPTNAIVWSDSVTADSSERVTESFMVYSGKYLVTQINTNGTSRELRGSVISGDLSASGFKLTVSGNYYKAGTTYKWLVWA